MRFRNFVVSFITFALVVAIVPRPALAARAPMDPSNPAWSNYYANPNDQNLWESFCAGGKAHKVLNANGVPACGPTGAIPISVPTNVSNPQVNPLSGISGWQCVELAERYLYVKYRWPALGNMTGATLVDRYHQLHPNIPMHTNAEHVLPNIGDVISFADNPTNSDGHVAIVTDVIRDPDVPDKGKIVFIGQNQKPTAGDYTADQAHLKYVRGSVTSAPYNPAYATIKWLDLRNAAAAATAIRAWGADVFGETHTPAGLTGVTAIAAGLHHGLAVRIDGTVVSWGTNFYGEGAVPADLADVVAVGAADVHSIALGHNGTVRAWGADPYGETDVPAGLGNVTAIATGTASRDNLALKGDGTVVAWGSNFAGERDVPAGLTSVKAIAAGTRHNLALKQDGTVVGWGSNQYGEATPPPGLVNITAISAGDHHSLALRADGTVAIWGSFDYDQYGNHYSVPVYLPAGLTNVVSISCGLSHAIAVKGDGTVVIWGPNYAGQNDVPPDLGHVQQVAGGTAYTVAIVNPA